MATRQEGEFSQVSNIVQVVMPINPFAFRITEDEITRATEDDITRIIEASSVPEVVPVLEGLFINANEVDLSWTAASVNGIAATEYEILRSDDDGPYNVIGTSSTLEYQDLTIDLTTTGYAYEVRASFPDVGTESNIVTFGEVGGLVELYDVRSHANFPEGGLAYAIDIDSANNRLFLVACDRRVGPIYASHLMCWNLAANGDLDSVAYTEDFTLFPDETSYDTFREYFSIYYPGASKFHVVRWSGMSTMNYNTVTGALSASSHRNDLQNYPGGRYGPLNGMVLKPGGNQYFVSSAGRNSFLQAIPVPENADQGAPIATSRETYYNEVAKLTGSETIFYVADSGGGNMTRNSIDSAGVITQLDSVATGMSTSGLDDGNMVHCNVFDGYLYAQNVTTAQQPPLQPTRRWPITDMTTGVLGAHEDGSWDFRSDYQYLISIGNPGFRSALVHNGHTYFIRAADGDLHKLFRT